MGKNISSINEQLYDNKCPLLCAMDIFDSKWKLPIIWYINDNENHKLRYKELQRKLILITPTMLTKCLRELEHDKMIKRTQFDTIPPTVEYSLTTLGESLIPALNSLFEWAESNIAR